MGMHSLRIQLRKLVHNTVLLTLLIYSPTVKLIISMNFKKKYTINLESVYMQKKILFALFCSLLLFFPAYEQRNFVAGRFVFVVLLTPWFYSCCIAYIRNILRYMGYIILARDLGFKGKNLYHLYFCIIIYVALIAMALEAIVHWIYVYYWRDASTEREERKIHIPG